ncbi:FKBP-type peptidyl-prolyl cis-trans isomerase [Demequina mangrovi]|uniref:Peptidyl-prolyl cis-trans isomerase n=1 Tax=Demequina mangrovi TaxID=1043493 RepID=A0A1H6TGD9_9MICO|nr:FKBP-type peptidyl-prolyl cis-trans isomerase [Demequina mangrovi]SEI79153.1 peptidylprolyl isomerase [Demequina mangrovi]
MRRLVVLALALVPLALGGCSASTSSAEPSASTIGDISDIVIGGSDTLAPSLEFTPGLEYTSEQSELVWDGEGEHLEDGQPLLLDIYGASLVDGTTLINTYDGLPRSFVLAPEVVGEELYERLLAVRVGARLLVVAPPSLAAESEPPIAMVVDVLPDHAVGNEIDAGPAFPTVTRDRLTGEPSVEIPKGDPPADLQVATLVQGSGAQVKDGSYLTVNYSAWYWSKGEDEDGSWVKGDVFDSSWPVSTAPFELQIGSGQVIRGLDEGLLDQTAGSQVLLVVPASYGYAAKGTLVFVVDILDVWNPEGSA